MPVAVRVSPSGFQMVSSFSRGSGIFGALQACYIPTSNQKVSGGRWLLLQHIASLLKISLWSLRDLRESLHPQMYE